VRAWKPILAALVIFTAGVSIGHLVIPSEPTAETERRRGSWQGGRSGPDRRGGQPGRPPWSPVLSEEQIVGICGRMTADLELTTAQSNEISMILKDSQARMKAIADEYLPRTRGEFFRTREAIQAVLTEEQRNTFEEGWKRRHSREGRSRDGAPSSGKPRPAPPQGIGSEQPPPPDTPPPTP
jgi:hypothetical protein